MSGHDSKALFGSRRFDTPQNITKGLYRQSSKSTKSVSNGDIQRGESLSMGKQRKSALSSQLLSSSMVMRPAVTTRPMTSMMMKSFIGKPGSSMRGMPNNFNGRGPPPGGMTQQGSFMRKNSTAQTTDRQYSNLPPALLHDERGPVGGNPNGPNAAALRTPQKSFLPMMSNFQPSMSLRPLQSTYNTQTGAVLPMKSVYPVKQDITSIVPGFKEVSNGTFQNPKSHQQLYNMSTASRNSSVSQGAQPKSDLETVSSPPLNNRPSLKPFSTPFTSFKSSAEMSQQSKIPRMSAPSDPAMQANPMRSMLGPQSSIYSSSMQNPVGEDLKSRNSQTMLAKSFIMPEFKASQPFFHSTTFNMPPRPPPQYQGNNLIPSQSMISMQQKTPANAPMYFMSKLGAPASQQFFMKPVYNPTQYSSISPELMKSALISKMSSKVRDPRQPTENLAGSFTQEQPSKSSGKSQAIQQLNQTLIDPRLKPPYDNPATHLLPGFEQLNNMSRKSLPPVDSEGVFPTSNLSNKQHNLKINEEKSFPFSTGHKSSGMPFSKTPPLHTAKSHSSSLSVASKQDQMSSSQLAHGPSHESTLSVDIRPFPKDRDQQTMRFPQKSVSSDSHRDAFESYDIVKSTSYTSSLNDPKLSRTPSSNELQRRKMSLKEYTKQSPETETLSPYRLAEMLSKTSRQSQPGKHIQPTSGKSSFLHRHTLHSRPSSLLRKMIGSFKTQGGSPSNVLLSKRRSYDESELGKKLSPLSTNKMSSEISPKSKRSEPSLETTEQQSKATLSEEYSSGYTSVQLKGKPLSHSLRRPKSSSTHKPKPSLLFLKSSYANSQDGAKSPILGNEERILNVTDSSENAYSDTCLKPSSSMGYDSQGSAPGSHKSKTNVQERISQERPVSRGIQTRSLSLRDIQEIIASYSPRDILDIDSSAQLYQLNHALGADMFPWYQKIKEQNLLHHPFTSLTCRLPINSKMFSLQAAHSKSPYSFGRKKLYNMSRWIANRQALRYARPTHRLCWTSYNSAIKNLVAYNKKVHKSPCDYWNKV